MRIDIRGKRWSLVFRRIRATKDGPILGLCDNADRIITIHKPLEGQELLNTLVHELTHACLPDTAEDSVDDTAESIAAALWQLGYRRTK